MRLKIPISTQAERELLEVQTNVAGVGKRLKGLASSRSAQAEGKRRGSGGVWKSRVPGCRSSGREVSCGGVGLAVPDRWELGRIYKSNFPTLVRSL